jgi:prevent-host-death family protein
MKSSIVTIRQARANLSHLLRRATNGEDVIIARGSTPIARLVPIRRVTGRRNPGSLKGTLTVGSEFFTDLPADELTAWE